MIFFLFSHRMHQQHRNVSSPDHAMGDAAYEPVAESRMPARTYRDQIHTCHFRAVAGISETGVADLRTTRSATLPINQRLSLDCPRVHITSDPPRFLPQNA